MGSMKTFLKENIKGIVFVLLFIIVDTVFITQYTVGQGMHIAFAITLGFAIAAILDAASYIASSLGLAALYEIPKIEQEEVKNDIKVSRIIFIVAISIVILSQFALVGIRIIQISGKLYAEKIERVDYEKQILAIDNDSSLSSIEKARAKGNITSAAYDGNFIFDMLSVIVPIITSVLSFIIGLYSRKKYDKFDKRQASLIEERDKIQADLDNLFRLFEDRKSQIVKFAGNINFKNSTCQELLDIKPKLIKSMEDSLRSDVPELYKNDIIDLYNSYNADVLQIKSDLSQNATNKSVIRNHDYLNDEKLKEHIEQLKTLHKDI